MTTQMNLKLFMVFAIVHRSKGSSNKGNLRNIDFFRSIRQRWFLNNNVCSESFIHEENRREQFFPGFHRVKCFQHDVSCNTLHACILLRFVFVLRDMYKKKKKEKKTIVMKRGLKQICVETEFVACFLITVILFDERNQYVERIKSAFGSRSIYIYIYNGK